jgi:hypothetical protein
VFNIGGSLAAARRAQALELADVERLTGIRRRHLAAVEADRFEAVPGRAYARAYLRTYAKSLGLDADRFVDEFEAQFPDRAEVELFVRAPRRHRPLPVRTLVAVAAIGGVTGFVAWSGSTNQASPPRPVAAARHTAPAVRILPPKPAAPRLAPVPAALVVHAVGGDCWLIVRRGGASGPVLYEATLPQGQSVRFGPQHLWIRFGAPWNVVADRGVKAVAGLRSSARAPIDLTL